MNELTNLGADVIVNAINENRADVVALLLKNGVVAPSSLTDFELAQVVTEVLRKSKNFQKEFVEFIGELMVSQSDLEMSGYSNAGGSFSDMFNISPSPFSTTTTTPSGTSAGTTTTAPKTGFTLDKGLNILTQGLNAFLTLDTNKTNRALAEASVKNAQSGGTTQDSQISNAPTKSNTTLYVILAILGIVVVGGGIFYAVKRKNS